MKVILTQDVRGQGKRGQMIEVSDGYARNFLLPRKLAQEATADNINTMRMNDKATQERQAKERAEALELRNRMKDMTVVVTAKGGGAGRLFGSVTNQEIAAGTWQSGNGLTDPVTNSTQVQAPVQSATPSADAVVTAPAAGWSVQIGFFTERDNALAYAAHAEAVLASTSSARSARLVRDNGGYRVVLGNGMSLNEARAAALNVKDIIGSGAFAVQK